MKVLVSVFNNLYTDQRVEKVCRTLHENGYEVELIGNNWGGAPEMKRTYPFYRIPMKSNKLRNAYLEFNKKLYSELVNRADEKTILLANDLDTLLPNYLVSKKLKLPLVFDSHEIFTEMPSIQGRWVRKVWKLLEKWLVPKMNLMMTESQSYADWFAKEYGVKPFVVRNIPRKINEDIEIPDNNPKILLYQGAINQSRGLPQAILAMKLLENVIFKIAGEGPKRKEYEDLVVKQGLQSKVQFLGNLVPNDLRKLTKTADVGLSVEENGGVSYLYSLPNKVSDYIQSRVPIVMINFPEMKRVYNDFKVGEMIENHKPETIAGAVKKVLKNGRFSYQNELNKAAQKLCWENEEEKILKLYELASEQLKNR